MISFRETMLNVSLMHVIMIKQIKKKQEKENKKYTITLQLTLVNGRLFSKECCKVDWGKKKNEFVLKARKLNRNDRLKRKITRRFVKVLTRFILLLYFFSLLWSKNAELREINSRRKEK